MDALNQSELYERLHRGHDGDLCFYENACTDCNRVLELGAGAGRVTIPIARAGAQVLGVEIDEAMLTLARRAVALETPEVQARVGWVQSDMSDFTLAGRFDRVILPYNTLLCLLSSEEVARCLACAHRHLKPDGQLIFDVYRADTMHEEDDDDDEDDHEPIVTIDHAAGVFDVYEQSTWLRQEQRLDTVYHFIPRDGQEAFAQHIPQRYLLGPEIHQLLRDSGFRLLRHEGGFFGEPLDEEALHHVVVASRD
ncbi:MAG: class I SAM-dependent methyltransferase [Polyangiaceae bacterium]